MAVIVRSVNGYHCQSNQSTAVIVRPINSCHCQIAHSVAVTVKSMNGCHCQINGYHCQTNQSIAVIVIPMLKDWLRLAQVDMGINVLQGKRMLCPLMWKVWQRHGSAHVYEWFTTTCSLVQVRTSWPQHWPRACWREMAVTSQIKLSLYPSCYQSSTLFLPPAYVCLLNSN